MQANKLFVGSLPFSVTDETLGEAFAKCGTVVSAKVIMDRDSGRSKGFGFVEMSSDEEAQNAIRMMADAELEGRRLTVNIAKPMPERNSRPRY
jgi:cold-inducible RNA-binding protein